MGARIRIGNQTALSAATMWAPFEFAVAQGFDAFEWFEDKKTNADGSIRGWDAAELNFSARWAICDLGRNHDIRFSVHAPWDANPVSTGQIERLRRSIDFARDIGAGIVNLHLYLEQGVAAYVRAVLKLLPYAEKAGVRLTLENTPITAPEDVNATFREMRALGGSSGSEVGLCLDIGHAYLCAATRRNFVAYFDALAGVPISYLHVHENHGDADSHLPLFTGPAGSDDTDLRALLTRLLQRGFTGAMILEQWPGNPAVLVESRRRLLSLLSATQQAANCTPEHACSLA
jgi:sugar phosphate isomerase/epimerase